MTTRKRILVIEDEPDLVRGLRDAFEFEGFEVESAGKGNEGLRVARERPPDCIVLDLMLPDMNGYEVCEAVRGTNRVVPIIMLTARSLEGDKIRGFDVGADDYVTKPFSVNELIARVRAIFRRLNRTATAAEDVLVIGQAEVDLKKHAVTRGRRTEPLTFYEVELLKMLHERLEQPVSRDEILEKIWGLDALPTNRTVDNFIVKLRRKLETDHKQPRHILTVYGHGYKLVL